MGQLDLQVLGPLRIMHEHQPILLPTHKAEALLLYLAVEGDPHAREQLARWLWPESEPARARANLRSTLLQLRQALGEQEQHHPQPHLHTTFHQVGLRHDERLRLDLQLVSAAWSRLRPLAKDEPMSEHDLAQGEQALAPVRGPFAQGLSIQDAPDMEEWIHTQQHIWQRRVNDLFTWLATAYTHRGQWQQALVLLERWLNLDPLSDEAIRLLMQTYTTLDQPREALATYRRYRELLRETLQTEPDTELQALALHLQQTVILSGPIPQRSSRSTPTALLEQGPMVGRGREFATLVEAYMTLARGQPSVVAIQGESGIGKSRLAREFAPWAKNQGADVLLGHTAPTAGRLPYQPFIELLRARLERLNAPDDLLEDIWLTELSRLLPELRERYPDLPTPINDPTLGPTHLYEAVARLLRALAQQQPLLLVLEDLHWADQASLDLLAYLADSWQRQPIPILLLLTYRHDEGAQSLQLRSWLHVIQRALPITELALQPLSEQDTLRYLQWLQGSPTPAPPASAPTQRQRVPTAPTDLEQLNQQLYRRTAGQPFYLIETLRDLFEHQQVQLEETASGGWQIDIVQLLSMAPALHRLLPTRVHQLVSSRLEQFSAEGRWLLRSAAILEQPMELEDILQISQLSEPQGLQALDEVLRTRLLQERSPEGEQDEITYRFAHDLIREIIYTEQGLTQRQRLHQRAFRQLHTRQAPPARLAYHAQQAGMVREAFHYLIQAGDEAMNMFAVQDAIFSYKESQTLLDKYQRVLSETDGQNFQDIQQLYRHLGRAYEVLEQWEHAGQTYETMLNIARQTHQPVLACIALNQLALLAMQQGFDIDRAIALLQEANILAIERQDLLMEAEIAWNLAQTLIHVWRLHEAERHGLRALELARHLQLLELEARSYYVLTAIYFWLGMFPQTITNATDAIDLYTKLNGQNAEDPSLPTYIIVSGAMPSFHDANLAALIGSLITRLDGYVGVGNVEAALADGQRALSLSQEMKNISLQAWSLLNLSHIYIETGQYEEALRVALQAHEIIQTSSNVLMRYYVLYALGCAYQALFQLEKARDTFEEALTLINHSPSTEQQRLLVIPHFCANAVLQGKWQEAAQRAREAMQLRDQGEAILLLKDTRTALETQALLHVGDEATARQLVERLGTCVGDNQRHRLPYLHARALLSQNQGEIAQAVSDGQEALQLAYELGLPGEQWQIQVTLGNLYAQQEHHKQEQEAMTQAAAIVRHLAEQIQDEGLRSSFLATPLVHRVLEWQTKES